MLRRPRLPTMFRPFPALAGRRSVFVMSHEKRPKPKRKSDKLKRWAEDYEDRKLREENEAYARKLKELKLLSRSLLQYVKRKNAQQEESEKLKNMPLPSEVQPEIKAVGGGGGFDPRKASLATPSTEIPASIEEKLGLAVKYLVSRENQNWSLVLHQLLEAGGVAGVPERDIRKMVYAIPKKQLRHVFPQIEALLAQANIATSPKIINAYLRSVIGGATVSPEDLALVEKYAEQIRASSRKNKLPRETFELLVETYGKASDITLMNRIIKEMKEAGLQTSSTVYSNVLSTCVYKSRDHKQAVQLFDLMKFLAGSMAPSTREYQDVIVSYVNNDDIEKALDLYQEMLSNNIAMNQNIMVALARGCISREQLKFKAWDFIFEIYKCNWVPTVPTLEYMLYLASKDGDLALARALYQQLNISKATSGRSFSFLLLAYAKSSVSRSSDNYKPLAITASETGQNFRRNILELADFSLRTDDPVQAVPFLPVLTLSTAEELLAELSAIMAHTLMVHPEYVQTSSVNTFMSVAASVGLLDSFKDRFEQFSYLDRTGVPATRTVEPEVGEMLDSLESLEDDSPKEKNSTKSPVLERVAQSLKNTFKVPRNTFSYIVALKAASKLKDYNFAQTIWSERGTYRTSENFRKLPQDERDKLDFSFASSMVNTLTELNLLEDALAILISTEYQFKWTWKELRALYGAAVEVGHDNITRTIRGVVKRAQVTHEGKIRRKDYKQYVTKRGY